VNNSKIAIYINYLKSYSHNNILYICKQYIKITKLHLAYSEVAYYSESYLQSLQHNLPSTICIFLSQCCPPVPRCPSHCFCTAILFVFVHLYDSNWDCCGLVVVKCGGSTHH